MARCEICGKAKSVGYRVSHSNIKTKRTFSPNIQRVRATLDGHAKSLRLHLVPPFRQGQEGRKGRPVSEV